MNREEILKELNKHKTTVLSFPNRGPWGNSSYRGNCTGWIPAFFIDLVKAQKVAEVFAGSGTTYDVCKDMGVQYVGIDLNPNPVRDGIVSMDIMDDSKELPDGFYNADLAFLHPPYPSIHDIKYANVMWKGTEDIASHDIQNMSWEKGMAAVNHAVMRTYQALPAGSFEAVLVGEIRSKGTYRSMMQNLVIPGILHQTFVKLQHNTMSSHRTYHNVTYAYTAHEMIALIKKPSGYEIAFVMPETHKIDIRDSNATWKDVVMAVVRNYNKGTFTNQDVYQNLVSHKKAASNVHWKAKVRQTLQKLALSGMIIDAGIGKWTVMV